MLLISGVTRSCGTVALEEHMIGGNALCLKLIYGFVNCLVPLGVVHKNGGEENIFCAVSVMGMNALDYLLVALFPLCTGGRVKNVDIVFVGDAVVGVILTKGKNCDVWCVF